MARVLERVVGTARANDMFAPRTQVLVACSGGADSLCLLHTLVMLRRLLRIRPVCFHFDHGLRESSKADATYVASQAKRLGVPFVLRRAVTAPGRGESVEAWARTERYGAIRAALEDSGGGVSAVGHTMDDQAETVLLALVRGGGLNAVSAMAPVAGEVVRPLLRVTREETRAFCRALRLRPREDPMNEDPSYLRVAVRRRVIPALEAAVGRNVRETLARTATLLRRDAELLEQLARDAARTTIAREADDVLLDASRLTGAPPAIASRVVRTALLGAGLVPEAAHVEAVLALATGARTGRRIDLPGGLLAVRERRYVRVSRPSLRRPVGTASGGEDQDR